MDAASILRTARRRQGLTQAEVARRIGTSQPVISAYESGARDPSTSTLRRLVEGTGERLELRLADTGSNAVTSAADRGAALVDVLLLADAIPVRRAPGPLRFPRIDSTRR